MGWKPTMPDSEIERRRIASINALKARDREEWNAKYQEICDTEYFKNGPCCAGCDHWQSDAGLTGNCSAAGILSGAEVARSLGWEGSSYTPAPGFPFTRSHFHCGKFKDEFDWESLERDYLMRIGYFREPRTQKAPTD